MRGLMYVNPTANYRRNKLLVRCNHVVSPGETVFVSGAGDDRYAVSPVPVPSWRRNDRWRGPAPVAIPERART
jgi:hypothetical protein